MLVLKAKGHNIHVLCMSQSKMGYDLKVNAYSCCLNAMLYTSLQSTVASHPIADTKLDIHLLYA
jgi:hypothetical protein